MSLKKLRVDLPVAADPPTVKLACGLSNLANLQVLSIRRMKEIEGFEVSALCSLPYIRATKLGFRGHEKAFECISLDFLEEESRIFFTRYSLNMTKFVGEGRGGFTAPP